MPTELGYYTLSVKDLDRAAAFYGPLFGWEFTREHETYLHVTNSTLPMGLNAGGPSSQPNLYYKVDDLDAAIARVHELGGTTDEPYESKSGRGCACTDDQGTVISLWQPAPGL
ncbi:MULTISPECIES: VOC family protein [Nonomuraea]|uniref:VOC family protein n=2 Tax=Nonomuraea TaxID=83681 RepID=A0ABW1BZX0_9ACTN|nr:MULTISPECIES: VOC family protein [Nonomuraea]MDA0643463.1 VOC family protein [Nonomuraea ferruginea]TXK40661.1 bleomycin resistance protein [Nonomuraea sp. C10]